MSESTIWKPSSVRIPTTVRNCPPRIPCIWPQKSWTAKFDETKSPGTNQATGNTSKRFFPQRTFGRLSPIIAKNARRLVGQPLGVITSDRFSAYHHLGPDHRQICWSHLKRDFQGATDQKNEASATAKELIRIAQKMHQSWKSVRDGDGPD